MFHIYFAFYVNLLGFSFCHCTWQLNNSETLIKALCVFLLVLNVYWNPSIMTTLSHESFLSPFKLQKIQLKPVQKQHYLNTVITTSQEYWHSDITGQNVYFLVAKTFSKSYMCSDLTLRSCVQKAKMPTAQKKFHFKNISMCTSMSLL